MTRNILLSTVLIFFLLPLSHGQVTQPEFTNLRFGAELSPFVSWMHTNDNTINTNGVNVGFRVGAIAEYYFAENYAIVSGLGMSFNNGGTLRHEVGGDLLARSEFSQEELHDLDDGTDIKYRLRYLEIPIGLKMRTREFGYIRYFVNIPVFTLSTLVQARGDIMAPNVSSNRENIYKDVFFFNLSWGLGGGFEYSFSTETSATFGLYYHQSFIDMTRDKGQKSNGMQEDSKGNMSSVSIRLGILF